MIPSEVKLAIFVEIGISLLKKRARSTADKSTQCKMFVINHLS